MMDEYDNSLPRINIFFFWLLVTASKCPPKSTDAQNPNVYPIPKYPTACSHRSKADPAMAAPAEEATRRTGFPKTENANLEAATTSLKYKRV